MRILVVDDERKMGILVKGALEKAGHEVEAEEVSKQAAERLAKEPFDLLITDLKMAPPDGLALLKHAREVSPRTDVILMTAYASAQTAVEAMQAGAYDYLIKPFELGELRLRVDKLGREKNLSDSVRLLKKENDLLREESGSKPRLGGMIGKSPQIKSVFEQAEMVAATDATVLIRGESGTGKSLLAKAIHNASPRAEKPLVTVNCGALPENLLESELFGHEKGAFTGAVAKKLGRFKTAEGGSIFLDEIGEMSPHLQVKLLQVLEEKQFYPVGGEQPETADVRVIAATNRNLEDAIDEGEFREDLFYRLNVFPISIPPLRARKQDLALLLDFFLSRYDRGANDLSEEARHALLDYPFPGNVREIENMVERAAILSGSGSIEKRHFPSLDRPRSSKATKAAMTEIPDDGLNLEELEKELIIKALEKSGGNKTQAAKLLGLTRRTLYSRLERHGLSA
ncbi:MAG: sigma-54-dependent Fis family transcriptional regulator [Candidatus Eisenbacteria bacterium]|uniref:Sigma-54-dependent Fis family transcriptional regulator n=1 Tax=Eiseniibacteriota bacterium TaxID=2212470 RepID=A0A7Y2E791_UNCEI|nr:sigma-54-dependent Fis family transcriptional regulator [Candidatus Eisenbacteria bacterium]